MHVQFSVVEERNCLVAVEGVNKEAVVGHPGFWNIVRELGGLKLPEEPGTEPRHFKWAQAGNENHNITKVLLNVARSWLKMANLLVKLPNDERLQVKDKNPMIQVMARKSFLPNFANYLKDCSAFHHHRTSAKPGIWNGKSEYATLNDRVKDLLRSQVFHLLVNVKAANNLITSRHGAHNRLILERLTQLQQRVTAKFVPLPNETDAHVRGRQHKKVFDREVTAEEKYNQDHLQFILDSHSERIADGVKAHLQHVADPTIPWTETSAVDKMGPIPIQYPVFGAMQRRTSKTKNMWIGSYYYQPKSFLK